MMINERYFPFIFPLTIRAFFYFILCIVTIELISLAIGKVVCSNLNEPTQFYHQLLRINHEIIPLTNDFFFIFYYCNS
jgi:hypothetical protein